MARLVGGRRLSAHQQRLQQLRWEFEIVASKKYAAIAAAINAAAASEAAAASSIAAAAAAGAPPFTQNECALCARAFDESERAPRMLVCGHTFCTACVGERLLKTGGRTGPWRFTCPVDQVATSVTRGNVALLELNSSCASAEAPLFRIHLRNMAGDTVSMLIVSATSTIGDVKRALYDSNHVYVVYQQRLSMQGADGELVVLNDDTAMLGALRIGREQVVNVVVQDPFSGGAYVRTICCSDEEVDGWRFGCCVCVSPCGQFVFVSDLGIHHQVSMIRMTNGLCERIFAFESDFGTADICVSRDGSLLFVATGFRVDMFRVEDGVLVRSIDVAEGDGDHQLHFQICDMCLSVDGEFLFVKEGGGIKRIQVVRVSDASYVRSIALTFNPMSMRLSVDGESLFVVASRHPDVAYEAPVHVVRVKDGVHIRTLGSRGLGYFHSPAYVCASRDGEFLFVSDSLANCVHVLHTSDGAYVHSFGSKGERSDDGRFSHPGHMCLSASGEQLLVADGGPGSDYARVQAFNPLGLDLFFSKFGAKIFNHGLHHGI